MTRFLSLLALALVGSTAVAQTVPPLRIYDEGTRLPLRYRLNLVGTAVACVDDPTRAQITCTFTGTGGGGGGGTGTVTSITAGTGLSGGTITASGTISLPNIGPGAGTVGGGSSYVHSLTLDAQGRVTAVATASPYSGPNPTPVKTSSYSAVDRDLVRCDPTSAGFSVTLPAASASKVVVVKNQSSSNNTVTVVPVGSDTIDGASSFLISLGRGSITLYSDGVSDWMVN